MVVSQRSDWAVFGESARALAKIAAQTFTVRFDDRQHARGGPIAHQDLA